VSAGVVVYVALVMTLAAVTAWAAESLCRQLGRPARWAWVGVFAVTLLVIGRAMVEMRAVQPTAMLGRIPFTVATSGPAQAASWLSTVIGVVGVVTAAARAMLEAILHRVPAGMAAFAGSAWMLVSLIALALLAAVHLRIRRARREWAEAELFGARVYIAPDIGPAVIGMVRPQIVVPRWLMARSPSEQQLVLAHEREHLDARDHLLLGAGCLMVALVPWHPAAWWMLSRLRLAIELDCDARVLRRGVPARTYGTLLIDLADRCTGFRAGATALADEGSHLERRLLAMKTNEMKRSLLRAGVLGATAALALIAACEAKVPTGPEIQAMDVASASKTMASTRFLTKRDMDSTIFYVDGKLVDAKTANSLTPNQIATINVTKTGGELAPSVIRIATTGEAPKQGLDYERSKVRLDSATIVAEKQGNRMMLKSSSDPAAQPLVLIDGVKADQARLAAIDPKQILGVEVIKGSAALSMSSDPAAKNGIIKVTTKK